MAYGWHFDKLIGMALIACSWHVMGSTFVLPVSYLEMPRGGLVGKRITSGTTCTPSEPGSSLSFPLSIYLPSSVSLHCTSKQRHLNGSVANVLITELICVRYLYSSTEQ